LVGNFCVISSMNRLWVILFVFTNILLSQLSNPCIDSRYLEIKNKSLDKMSDREYKYFSRKDEECSQYKLSIQPANKMVQPVNKPDAFEPKLVPKKMETINLYGTTESLTISQKQRFNRERLTVEIITKTSGSAAATPLGGSAVLASYGSQTSRKWTASKGFEKISEESFLRIAGYDEEANVVKQYASSNSSLMLGGLLAFIAGKLYADSGRKNLDKYEYGEAGYDNAYDVFDRRSMTGALVGISGIGVSVYGLINSGNNRYEYSVVDGIAEDYNKKLFAKIKESSE